VSDGLHGMGSGVVAGRDVHLAGEVVAGRDLTIQNVQIVPPPERTRLFQLPPDIGDFTNRDDAIHEVRRLLEDGRAGNGTAIVVSAIAGKAGVGKTALATRIAHQLRPHFPDGQLYVNLRGGEDKRQDPGIVLGEFLLELGVARAAIPEDLEQRAARYRAQLAGHRILVVLDNAADETQVRLLLPGSPGCAALITSRAALTGLSGTRLFMLDVLELDQGVELLARIAGRDRVEAEPDKAREIVRLCGYLPLAVRIAGGKLAARPHWTLAMLADRLAVDHNLLAELKLRDLEVRASFELSYHDLTEEERRAFRLLGLLRTPDFTNWVASALLNREFVEAEDLLTRLVEAQVLEAARDPKTGELRYRFHDLLRAYAREQLWAEEPPASQEAALHRSLDAHVLLAEYAAALLEPGNAEEASADGWLATRSKTIAERIAADPAAWFAAERVNLISVVEQADEQRVPEVVWRLARALNYFFKLRSHWTDWEHTQRLALRAARRAGDRSAKANALRSLGDVTTQRKQFEEAVEHFTAAMDLFRSLSDRHGEAWTNVGLGTAYLDDARFSDAIAQFEHALRLFDAIGDARGRAWALVSVGIVHRIQGRLSEAKVCLKDSLAQFRILGDRRGEAYSLVNLGIVHRHKGQFEDALSWFDQARPIFRELVDHHGETFVLLNIGYMHREEGRLDDAVTALDTCLATFREFGERGGEAWTLLQLGMVWQAQGRRDEAVARFQHCLALFHELKDRWGTALTLLGLGEVYREQGRLADARASLDRSLPILEDLGDQLGRAKVLSSKGFVLKATGSQREAIVAWREALKIFKHLGASESAKVEKWLRNRGGSDAQDPRRVGRDRLRAAPPDSGGGVSPLREDPAARGVDNDLRRDQLPGGADAGAPGGRAGPERESPAPRLHHD
jgi:tetratricopeptide (TPR) repeat protein